MYKSKLKFYLESSLIMCYTIADSLLAKKEIKDVHWKYSREVFSDLI